MDDGLPPGFHPLDQPVGIGVATRQQNLEEQHQGGPDRRRAAKPGQNKFPDHRLDLKKEESRKKNTDSSQVS